MSLSTGMGVRAGTGLDPAAHEEQGWSALQHLVLARLLVAALALPFGILLRPEVSSSPVALLVNALGTVMLMTVLFGGLTKVRRGQQAQTAAQLVADLAFVSALAAHTGGRDSQFVLFYALVVITGGVLGRLAGGLMAAGGACIGFLALPYLAHLVGADPGVASQPRPEMLVAFLTIVGVLSGVLGDRVARTRGDLERTARELDRVRVDNDVVLRHLATGVFTVDASGVVGYLNPAAEQVLGLRVMETRGRHVSVALPERLGALRDIVIETQQSRRGRARAELLMRTASGRALPVGISTNVLMHQDEMTGVVAVFQDLTEVRDMERRARRNETLAEVGALAAGIAHELRNGLKPIAGSVEYLQRELQLEGEEAQLIDLIARESSRLNKFVTDLLAYSRERDLALVPVDLDDQLRDVVNTLAHDPRRGSDMHVTLEGGPGAAWVSMDPEQMHQVWLNLASNAMEAVGERGTFTIRWSAQADGGVVVDFVDSGPGIAAEDLPRVGEPFFTTKRGGTGLGLAIAQRIVERHGGVLTLESETGRGTTARVTLPGAAAPVAQVA